jgi:hypothetical protein
MMLKMAVTVMLYGLVSGLAAWTGADIATDYGLFGSCFEGGCGYGAIFLGFPVLWLSLFMLLIVTQRWVGLGLFGSWFEGRRKYALLLLGLPILWLVFLALFFVLLFVDEAIRRGEWGGF